MEPIEADGIAVWDPRLGPEDDPQAYVIGENNAALVLLDYIRRLTPEDRRMMVIERMDPVKLGSERYNEILDKVEAGRDPEPDVESFIEAANYCDEETEA